MLLLQSLQRNHGAGGGPCLKQQEGPPIGGAVRNATSLIPRRLSYTMLAITFCENVRALITVHRLAWVN